MGYTKEEAQREAEERNKASEARDEIWGEGRRKYHYEARGEDLYLIED